MKSLDWKTIPRPIVALSPMADMTDSAFCRTVRSIAQPLNHSTTSPLVVFREMVSSEAVVRGNEKTLGMTDIHPDERPLVQQLFGSDPDTMAEAARVIYEHHRPEAFDVNMGCPVYKIVHTFNGAALMKEPARATQIVQRMRSVLPAHVPVSVKIRAGWSDPTECLEFAKVLEAAGADLITVHGRTKVQGYAGKSDWARIKEVKQRVGIPVLANGDAHTAPLVMDALKATGCDGVLVARGALGNPWIFAQCDDLLAGRPMRPVTLEERVRVVRMHARLHEAQYGPGSLRTFRKHLSWYFKGQPGAKHFREKLLQVSTLGELSAILDGLMQKGGPEWASLVPSVTSPISSVHSSS
ncbi:tRNA dihydrouridine synthase DusB [Candidatus Uhrbacteria bacterium RIFCSPHIGHO2_01_FULL_63_20]|uniref:tRNA-dihydrouridine synthase n=1 Tax=Candidatus Uhrbacteria bacterium RIFCSPHIGHO2_01_FULL_63_20 TaxID=1802385 RepID=A0A1F7TLM6_9BACT|nr:MAG: tRNA dihydrouridine synthase DusB [Candidatus Uhrbacteria bacterium RIFCSPHIGHO2_01_FULL_63_20]